MDDCDHDDQCILHAVICIVYKVCVVDTTYILDAYRHVSDCVSLIIYVLSLAVHRVTIHIACMQAYQCRLSISTYDISQ